MNNAYWLDQHKKTGLKPVCRTILDPIDSHQNFSSPSLRQIVEHKIWTAIISTKYLILKLRGLQGNDVGKLLADKISLLNLQEITASKGFLQYQRI